MSVLFTLLFLVAGICFILGLIKPSIVKMRSRQAAGLTFGIAAIVCLIVSVAMFAPSTPANAPTQNNPEQPSAAQTNQQGLQATIQSALPNSTWSFGGISLASDTPFEQYNPPADAVFAKVKINVGDAWDDASIITESGQIAATIFQQAFENNPTYYDVGIEYDGQLTDQYGNTTTSEEIYYEMDRELYGKINWSGLSTVQNDVHMCAFLREEQNETQTDANGRSIGCLVIPYNLRQAEDTIETQNAAQYPDIPQQGS